MAPPPVEVKDPLRPQAGKSPAACHARAMARFLVIDDDNTLRQLMVATLEGAGHKVVQAASGAEAAKVFQLGTPDVVVTDIVMPEMDGIELARRASELDPDIKIMFITGFAAVALNPDSQAPKDAKVLSKPFHLRDLVNEVGKMLTAA